ncbi:MAG: DUF1722 domain-containing protein, partial [Vallitaleaceae bacterium]|nr:DUF1722 domain-containing protein [Vallitaleaceae bacterium]
YTVINSPHEEVVIRAIADVEYHTTFLDALGVNDSHKIILHVGGVYGDQVESIRRWVSAYAILSVRARARLVLENDDQHYTFEDVYGISQKCQIPILFDYFHHLCHHEGAYDLHDILRRVVNTWQAKDGSFKLHYSEQDLSKRKGAHAPSITMQNFMDFYKEVKSYNPFIMIEAKNKNIAAVKAKNCIAIVEETVRPRDVIEEWSKYKYVIMSYGYEHYKHIQKMMSTACTLQELYEALEEIMSSSKVDSAKTNTLSHVWGYLKDHANTKEKNHYFKLADNLETLDLAKDYLYKLCIKYQMDYLLQSYYFHF